MTSKELERELSKQREKLVAKNARDTLITLIQHPTDNQYAHLTLLEPPFLSEIQKLPTADQLRIEIWHLQHTRRISASTTPEQFLKSRPRLAQI